MLSEHDLPTGGYDGAGTGDGPARRARLANLEPADIARIKQARPVVVDHADALVETFFDYLAGDDGAAALFARPDSLAKAKRLKRRHLLAMVEGIYDDAYIEQRVELGKLYGSVGIDLGSFLGAFQQIISAIGVEIAKRFDDTGTAFAIFTALGKVNILDITIIVDVLLAERDSVINAQARAIHELSTPVLQLREGLLLMPLIGALDGARARQLTANLLSAIRAARARVAVMDITGVPAVDSRTANHLFQTIQAARLMGAKVITTGLSADVAQSLVAIGADVSNLNAVGDLQGGLEMAERMLGYGLVKTPFSSEPASVLPIPRPGRG